ncbi:MAG: DUF3817 domain-containing protein [Planctomycetota bacterium]
MDEAERSWRRTIGLLRVTAMVEGVSNVLLFFVAMPLKYGVDMPMAVTIVGSIHGGLFLVLIAVITYAWGKGLTFKLSVWSVVAAVVPFGPWVVDRRIKEAEPMRGVPSDAGNVWKQNGERE